MFDDIPEENKLSFNNTLMYLHRIPKRYLQQMIISKKPGLKHILDAINKADRQAFHNMLYCMGAVEKDSRIP
eukprot:11345352-Heterocapsa_arctica.AAC.1